MQGVSENTVVTKYRGIIASSRYKVDDNYSAMVTTVPENTTMFKYTQYVPRNVTMFGLIYHGVPENTAVFYICTGCSREYSRV